MVFPDITPYVPLLGPWNFDIGSMHFGPIGVRWYALAYIAGILIGWRYCVGLVRNARLWGGRAPTLDPAKIDDLVIQKLAERMQIVEKIGKYKKDNGITILQVNRWDEILQKRTQYGKALKLEADFTEKLLELIHSESIRKQTEIMNQAPVQEKLTHA